MRFPFRKYDFSFFILKYLVKGGSDPKKWVDVYVYVTYTLGGGGISWKNYVTADTYIENSKIPI